MDAGNHLRKTSLASTGAGLHLAYRKVACSSGSAPDEYSEQSRLDLTKIGRLAPENQRTKTNIGIAGLLMIVGVKLEVSPET